MRLTVPEPSGYTVIIHPQNNNNSGFAMADNSILKPLTGFDRFDQLIADFSDIADANEQEAARGRIREEFGVEGAVFISDMASSQHPK